MFEIDKQRFGAFIASLRKEKGYTQKELAQRLFISDKAVSKWETAASIPDTALLIPLADMLGVSVTELLMCERIKDSNTLDAGQVEGLVKTAISYSGDNAPRAYQNKSKWKLLYIVALLIGAVELFLLYMMNQLSENIGVMVLLGAIFGAYFCFFARNRLPTYHDENRITSYGDGPFRMNLPGVAINNSNWPYIVLVGRIWTTAMMIAFPVVFYLLMNCLPELWYSSGEVISAVIVVCSLFIPIVVVAKKYE